MSKKDKEMLGISILASVAILIMVFVVAGSIPTRTQGMPVQQNILITGAAVSSTVAVFTITTSDTSGAIKWKNRDGTTVSLPIAADGSAAGSSEAEHVFLATDAKNNPDQGVYLEGESCAATTITDCVGARFLAIQNKQAHILRIKSINTGKNEIDIQDVTYEKESKNNPYTDGTATLLTIGDLSVTLTITEAANTVAFTALGSSDGAQIELYDKATLEIINGNSASRLFEGITFSEYNDGALSPEKYIGVGGTAPLTIEVVYDNLYDSSIEIQSMIAALTKAQGSGWYTTNGVMSFYTNKGTLLFYDEKEKHSFSVNHVASTAAASLVIKKTAAEKQAAAWTIYGVDKEGDVGKASSLVLDSEGFAHMSYFDETNDTLKYVYETADGWYVQTVDGGNVGRSSDIALDSVGKPHIIYTDTKNSKLKYAQYDGDEWKRWTVEAAGTAAILPTLALDAVDAQYIAYYDYVADDLMLLFYDTKAQTWKSEVIDAEGDVGAEASIALGKNNNPHIVYFDNAYDLLKYVWYDGSAWQKTVIDSSGTAGLFTALAVDENNYPTVWYYNQLKDKVQYLRYVGDNKWEQKTFDLEGFDIWQGDILLDEKGYVHFSYYDKIEQDLRYAVGLWE